MGNRKVIYLDDALKALRPIMRKSDYFYEIQKAIQDVPSAEPERKKGKWILGKIETGAFNVQYQWKRCSECGWGSSLIIPENFCPNCGADMRGEQK